MVLKQCNSYGLFPLWLFVRRQVFYYCEELADNQLFSVLNKITVNKLECIHTRNTSNICTQKCKEKLQKKHQTKTIFMPFTLAGCIMVPFGNMQQQPFCVVLTGVCAKQLSLISVVVQPMEKYLLAHIVEALQLLFKIFYLASG